MNGKNINFNDKKNQKSDFYNKNKKIFNIDDIDINKTLVSKKEQYGKYNLSNISLDIMIMVLLHHYIYFFHNLLVILTNLIKIK